LRDQGTSTKGRGLLSAVRCRQPYGTSSGETGSPGAGRVDKHELDFVSLSVTRDLGLLCFIRASGRVNHTVSCMGDRLVTRW
jgi:hypothetical protein